MGEKTYIPLIDLTMVGCPNCAAFKNATLCAKLHEQCLKDPRLIFVTGSKIELALTERVNKLEEQVKLLLDRNGAHLNDEH